MAVQCIEVAEQVTRGVVVGDETWYPLPNMGSLRPAFNPVDEAVEEYRGADTGQGNSTQRRKESQWIWALESRLYPCPAMGLLFKHLFGYAGTRSVVDVDAYEGLLRPVNLPYGNGALLGDTALMFRVNYDNGEDVAVSRIYHGGRITSCNRKGGGTDDVMVTFNLEAPGDYIEDEAAAFAVADLSTFPAPYNSSDVLFYIGSGATRTGTAPNYTDIGPGTMNQFIPDSFDITIETGRKDKVVMNGVRGPSVTTKEGQLAISATFPVDVRRPGSGFSSGAAIEALHAGVAEHPIMMVMDSGDLAGATTQNYTWIEDFPRMALKPVNPDYNTQGKIPNASLEFSHLLSATTLYACAALTVDKEAAY